MDSSEDPPEFLAGTFIWDRNGYSYSRLPPNDALTPEALQSEDPWRVLTATLEQAKAGNHTSVGGLVSLIRLDSPHLVIYGALDVLADAATNAELALLKSLVSHENEDIRERSCWAAMQAGSMITVPYLLEAWRSARPTLRGTISFLLSMLLEEEWPLDENLGPIANGAGLPFDEFNVLVDTRFKMLRAKTGSQDAPIWGGRPFGVVSFTEHIISLILSIGNTPTAAGVFSKLRHKFEASTGISCSGFFKDRRFQPASALSILDAFLESPAAANYKEGVRYFFGHPIPEGTPGGHSGGETQRV